MTIAVYTKPAYSQSAYSTKSGIDYRTVDLTEVSDARDYVMALGYGGDDMNIQAGDHGHASTTKSVQASPVASGAATMHPTTPRQATTAEIYPRQSEWTYKAIISGPNQSDAMPMWESFDHATAADAYGAARAHIHATQPGDRIVDEGNGVYTVWAAESIAQPTHVATVVVAPADDLHAAPARKSEQARG